MRSLNLLRTLVLGTTLIAAGAWAQSTGVSDNRVSLPEGPGSLEGVGENVDLDPNMGLASYSVPVLVPPGYAGMTPGVSLSYSSGAGSSVVGIGWKSSLPNVERLTKRGLPTYDTDDEFISSEGGELVRIPGTSPPIYRSRFEGSFIRHTWMNAGDADNDYWVAEYPDGRVGYFGADEGGTAVPSARVSGAKGAFRYHLVDVVDRYQHRIHYTYTLFGNYTLPLQIGWVVDGNTPIYELTFSYEDRTDLLSDCKAGFEELLTKRLSQVFVRARGDLLRRYTLTYQSDAASGGFSRLAKVVLTDANDVAYPVQQQFEYSQALGGTCTSSDCDKPFIVVMAGPSRPA